MTKLSDIPSLGPFFFVEPDYSSSEALKMRRMFSSEHCCRFPVICNL